MSERFHTYENIHTEMFFSQLTAAYASTADFLFHNTCSNVTLYRHHFPPFALSLIKHEVIFVGLPFRLARMSLVTSIFGCVRAPTIVI